MKKTSILLPGLLLAASLFAWLQSGQVHLFANQGEWPVLLMLLGAVLLYQGKKEAAGPHVLIGLLLFGIGLHFFAKPELSWWPGDFEMILFVFGFSLFAAARKEYVYEAAAMIGFPSFYTSLNKLRRGWSPSIFRRNTSKHTGRMFSSESAFYYCLSSGTKLYDKTQNALRFGFFIIG